MEQTRRMEQFSLAYIQAVAACAGFAWSTASVDDDSIDMTLHLSRGNGTVRSPKLDLQAKCHTMEPATEDFSFPLKLKNYNDLRSTEVMVPRILVVLIVPANIQEWFGQTHDQIVIRRCGYWMSLRGRASTPNETSVTLTVPCSQQFDPNSLSNIMDRVGAGALP